MLNFEELDVSEDIKKVLLKYRVDFVFQPIFLRNGDLVGYEALMRPEGKNIMDFIEEMRDENKLHELELLTFFGATYAYRMRGYDKMLSINSFPEDSFSRKEALEYSLCFRPIKDKMIIEILEYTDEQNWTWELKQEHVNTYRGIEVALDDFGTGHNDMKAVDYYDPQIIKIDRSLISNIDTDPDKQDKVKDIVKTMNDRAVVVLAEGVETEDEYEYLKDIGIDYFQGFYLGRPA